MPPLPDLTLKVSGRSAASQILGAVAEVEVIARRGCPARFTMRLEFASEGDLFASVDGIVGKMLAPGTQIEIMRRTRRTQTSVLIGIVDTVGIDLDLDRTTRPPTIVVEGHDRAHLLTRQEKTRVFTAMSATDVAEHVASDHGLKSDTDASDRFAHMFQSGETDWDLLVRLAARIGFDVYVTGDTLHFQATGRRGESRMTWRRGLVRFMPLVTPSRQSAHVTVRGWDQVHKEEIVGEGSTGDPNPVGRSIQVSDGRLGTTQEAIDLAQAMADEIERSATTGTGLLRPGRPNVMPGVLATIGGLGTGFDGEYYVGATAHRFTVEGYTTSFEVGVPMPTRSSPDHRNVPVGIQRGTAIGIVTDTQDPDGLARVRVKFPWLGDDSTSSWARVATPMAGRDRGVFFIPEVDDEVLVAFEFGDIGAPYVVGSLWNHVDVPPETGSGGENDVRLIRSRSGHELRFDDTPGSESVEITTTTGQTIRLDDGNDRIEIVSGSGDRTILVDAGSGHIELRADRSITIESVGDLALKAGGDLTLEAGADLVATAASSASIEGVARAELTSSAQVKVKGAIVTIN
ncbi:MAG: phage baseplate assembly protein V [Actinomycetia bacterium]|nr:phage baseplate assembly protein V [Actinomycetes bacterium]